MAATHLFAPVPLRAMAVELSGLQMRVLTCVAAHDRMSLAKGKGQGCRASNDRMREMIGCSYGKLCASLNELVTEGLLQREKVGRHTIYRVIYNDDDVCLFGHTKGPAKGDHAVQSPEPTCDHRSSESRRNADENTPQYIPLNGGIDFVETKEINSDNRRIVADARRPAGIICQLPPGFNSLPMGARVSKFEAAFDRIGRDGDHLTDDERTKCTAWLFGVWDDHPDEPFGQQAMRILEEMEQYGSR